MKVLYAPEAVEDLLEIWLFIAKNADAEVAERFVDRLEAACEKIVEAPMGYRLRPELSVGLRSYPYGSYIIYFYPEAFGITIARVIHAARDVDPIFDNE